MILKSVDEILTFLKVSYWKLKLFFYFLDCLVFHFHQKFDQITFETFEIP